MLIAAIIGGGLLLIFFLLNRGSGGGGLVGPTWQLAAITEQAPAFQGVIPAEDQGRYTITFGDDGTFAARADCNSMAGTYEQKGQDGRGGADQPRPERVTLLDRMCVHGAARP